MITISIVTYNTDIEELKHCFASLSSHLVKKIYVIDNSCQSYLFEFCKSLQNVEYIPNENIFGKMLLGNRQIIQYKYIMDKDGNIKGYVTGAKLFNEAHLTTQVPNIIDIATNECKNFNKYENKNLNVIIRKPKIEINNENYKYLQLFDLIENKDNIGIEVDNPDEIIYNFIEENDLDFEKIIKYAMDTKSRTVINKILVLAR